VGAWRRSGLPLDWQLYLQDQACAPLANRSETG